MAGLAGLADVSTLARLLLPLLGALLVRALPWLEYLTETRSGTNQSNLIQSLPVHSHWPNRHMAVFFATTKGTLQAMLLLVVPVAKDVVGVVG